MRAGFSKRSLDWSGCSKGPIRVGFRPVVHTQDDNTRQSDRVHGNLQLRFGAVTTPRQRAVYRDLFVKIDAVRDQVVKQVRAADNPSMLSNLNPVFDFFSQLFSF